MSNSKPRCQAKGGAALCTDPDCPEKVAGMAAFFNVPVSTLEKPKKLKALSREEQHENLSTAMDFGHVISVGQDGKINSNPVDTGTYVEEVQYVDLNEDGSALEPVAPRGWEYLKGFTGQYGYRGAVMHSSESIGGAIADHMLENPGTYVSVIIDAAGFDEGEYNPDGPDENGNVGWGILRKIG